MNKEIEINTESLKRMMPDTLFKLIDDFFEITQGENLELSIKLIEMIKTNAVDLQIKIDRFIIAVLDRASIYADIAGKKAIAKVVELYNRKIAGDTPDREEWRAAAFAAYAAEDAAYNAAYSTPYSVERNVVAAVSVASSAAGHDIMAYGLIYISMRGEYAPPSEQAAELMWQRDTLLTLLAER